MHHELCPYRSCCPCPPYPIVCAGHCVPHIRLCEGHQVAGGRRDTVPCPSKAEEMNPKCLQPDGGLQGGSQPPSNPAIKAQSQSTHKTCLRNCFFGCCGIFTSVFMYFKTFAAFVRQSERFLYLPSSAVVLLLNLLLLPNRCHHGAAWASLELPASSRQEHWG